MPVSWEALPDVVRRKLCQDGKPLTPVLLWNMFMSDDEVCSFVESAGFVAGSVEWLRYSHVLCELWREAEHRAYLATRGLSSQLGAHCRAASGMRVQPPVAVVMTQETLLASAAVKRQLHWPCRLAKRRALARNEGGRARLRRMSFNAGDTSWPGSYGSAVSPYASRPCLLPTLIGFSRLRLAILGRRPYGRGSESG